MAFGRWTNAPTAADLVRTSAESLVCGICG